ncbi:MAG: hypothetical protein BWZ03_00651 [bacterium ADurb.BinA186]|nr:MAG: hypothetical protein BWZ03_00651 [bacterium ADurb.BinA186]
MAALVTIAFFILIGYTLTLVFKAIMNTREINKRDKQ